jgi:hypothetical protein
MENRLKPESVTVIRRADGGCVAIVWPSAVNEWARAWPCFGYAKRRVVATFDGRGDLVDLAGDKGLDESGMVALLADMQAIAQPEMSRARA